MIEITVNETELIAALTRLETMVGGLSVALSDLAFRVTALEEGIPDFQLPHGLRGVWLQMTTNTETARARVRAAADVGANAVFVFCGHGRAVTFQNSHNIPVVETLLDTIDEAKQNGIDVYACIPSSYFWRTDYPAQNARHSLGHTDDWLDFRNRDARELIAGLCADVAAYDIAGVCLDYTRWWRGSGQDAAFVTQTVAAAYEAIGGLTALCASPISIYDDSEWSALNYGQAWHDWLDDGIVDWLTPMVYSGQWHLDRRLQDWKGAGYWPDWVAPVLSPCTSGDINRPKTADAWRVEIQTVANADGRGIAVFDQGLLAQYPNHAQVLREEWGK